jgi:ribosome-interacting GTPase 1
MPANLTPQYLEAEKKLKTAKTPQEKIEVLEEMLAVIPKHKGTEKLQAQIKTKISKARDEQQKKPTAKHGPSSIINKQGAGQVLIVGPPNSGKSMLIKSLTGAEPEVGDYPFTTRIPAPYMMKYENIQIQLVDLPPLTPDIMESWQLELIKVADAVLIVVDVSSPDSPSLLETLFAKLKEKRIEFVRDLDILPEESSFPVFRKKTLLVANKKDLDAGGENLEALKFFFENQLATIPISAAQGEGLEELKKQIFSLLHIIRAYSKAPGRKPDHDEPFVLKRGSRVIDIARAVHKDFAEKLAYARLWREGQFTGQMVNRDQPLEDEDIVELHI